MTTVSAVGLVAVMLLATFMEGMGVQVVQELSYSLLCNVHYHHHNEFCFEYTYNRRFKTHKVHANYTHGELQTPRYRWNVVTWMNEDKEMIKIIKDQGEIPELKDVPYCVVQDTSNSAGAAKLRPCKANSFDEDASLIAEDSWYIDHVDPGRSEILSPHFKIKSDDGLSCLAVDFGHDEKDGYLFHMINDCSISNTTWTARDFISTAEPTSSPVPPTPKPSLAPVVANTPTQPPSSPPTNRPTRPNANQFPDRVILLREGLGTTSDALGFGVSTGDDNLAQIGDDLQVKSFEKLKNKDDLEKDKMIWYMDQKGRIHLSSQDDLVLVDNMSRPHHTNQVKASFRSFVTLDRVENVQAKFSEWEMHGRDGGYQIRRKALENDVHMCLTVAKCDLMDSVESTHWICQDRGNLPACKNGECDVENCDDPDTCICHKPEFKMRTCRILEPGSYIKVMKCDPEYDAVQVFRTMEIDNDSRPPTTSSPTFSPITTPPTTGPPTTTSKPPTQSPTKSTRSPTSSPTIGAGIKGTEEEVASSGFSFVLFLCVSLIVLLLCLVRKKAGSNVYRSRRTSSFGTPFEDDDDQGLFDSFDGSLGAGLYAEPPSASPTDANKSTSRTQARMLQHRSSNDPTSHFEQDQGFVARV